LAEAPGADRAFDLWRIEPGGVAEARRHLPQARGKLPRTARYRDKGRRCARLDAPGVWYAHVRVVDAAGNQLLIQRVSGDTLRVKIDRNSLVFVPGSAGLLIASEVIKDVLKMV